MHLLILEIPKSLLRFKKRIKIRKIIVGQAAAAKRLAIIISLITLRILARGDSQQTVAIAWARTIANQYAGAGAGEV